MQPESRSPFELNISLRILCAVAAVFVLVGFVIAPTGNRFGILGDAVMCIIMISNAIFGLRTRRNRLFTVLLLLIYLVLFMLQMKQPGLP